MVTTKYLKYQTASKLIKEGDILLFRAPETVWSFGYWVAAYTGGIHCHVGLASKTDDGGMVECVEFREFKGGRTVSLEQQVIEQSGQIDVFRPVRIVRSLEYKENVVSEYLHKYDEVTARNVTDTMRRMTGSPYGWANIFNILKCYLPVIRLRPRSKDDLQEPPVYVCSTGVAYALRKHFVDPVPYTPDELTTPADIARSPILNYLFTITKD